jgi:UDP-2-acetamido-3-amino-2,3-dideoxy-glucuronate N-acetyltransferase
VCGIEIGRFAFIGAGAVINRNVPDFALMVGNPGRQIGWMSKHGHRLHFDESSRAQCPETGQWYEKKDGKVAEAG